MTAQTLEDVVVNPPVNTVPCPSCLRVIPLFEAVDVRDVPDDINSNAFVCGACLHEEIRRGRVERSTVLQKLKPGPLPPSASVQINVTSSGPLP